VVNVISARQTSRFFHFNRCIICFINPLNTDCLLNCCWPSPAQWFLAPISARFMTIFYFRQASAFKDCPVLSSKLLLVLASQSFFVSGPVGTHDHIFVLSKTFTCFEIGPPLQREEGSDYYWSLPLYWGWLEHAVNNWPLSPRYPLDRRLAGPQSRSGSYGEEKNLLLLPGIEPRPSSPQPVSIPTELSRLYNNQSLTYFFFIWTMRL
jgi:hypothetical protein